MAKLLLLGVLVAACTNNDTPAHPDAPAGEDGCRFGVLANECEVTITCDQGTTHEHVVVCNNSGDATTTQQSANKTAVDDTPCTTGASAISTCTVRPDAFTCPEAFALSESTVCIPGQDYSADVTAICADLPPDQGACSVACDRTALYDFAVGGKFSMYTCETIGGVRFVVGAAPKTGNGAR